ncbi:S-layer homology domain-containing protein [Paenibacillus illinoisensis]|uniref:S-layer homology domain-containing protein n=1 Tax=Paenibacillus illinoisensis TaxID=59845 RepID=UPI003D9620A6
MKKILLVSTAALTIFSTSAFQVSSVYALEKQKITNTLLDPSNKVNDDASQLINAVVATFKDIKGHWAESSILTAIKQGIVSGYPDGLFHPDNKVTRAEFLKLILVSSGYEVGTTNGGTWYSLYVTSAKANNLYNESDFPSSDWSKPMTRLEMVHVAVRAIGKTAASDKEFIYIAVKNGLISGVGNGKLDPDGTTTRAQALTVIDRINKVRNGETLKVDGVALANAEKVMNAKTDFWGHVIRTTDLPKNAKNYPYILEEYPNEMYEMKPYKTIDTNSMQLSKTDIAFNSKPTLDMWKKTTESYYDQILNVDYRTINETWATKTFSYMNQSNRTTFAEMKRYVKWVKDNKIVISGSLTAEPSMVMRSEKRHMYFIRSKFEFTLKSFTKYDEVMFDQYFKAASIKFKKGKKYEGYVDIPLSTNANDYDMKVSAATSFFDFGSVVRAAE